MNIQIYEKEWIINAAHSIKLMVWYHAFKHKEILPSIIETFLDLNRNITDIYLVAPQAEEFDFENLLNQYWSKKGTNFNLNVLLMPVSFKGNDRPLAHPNAHILSQLTPNDIMVVSTVKWTNKVIQRAMRFVDINKEYNLKYHLFFMFHTCPIQNTQNEPWAVQTYQKYSNGLFSALSLTPTHLLFDDNVVPIIPTYSYLSGNYKYIKHRNRKNKYTIMIQGGALKSNSEQRDKSLLLDILKHDTFQQKLKDRFIFKWCGRFDDDLSNDVERELFSEKYKESLLVMKNLPFDRFEQTVSSGDIFFTMMSEHTTKEYVTGQKFSATLI